MRRLETLISIAVFVLHIVLILFHPISGNLSISLLL
jgi:hypothetical protein